MFPLLIYIVFLIFSFNLSLDAVTTPAKVMSGLDVFLDEDYSHLLKGKRVGVLTNQTAVTANLTPIQESLKKHAQENGYKITAYFAPEHGLSGNIYAEEVVDTKNLEGIPIFSLYGKTRRPTAEMLKKIDILIYDIQDLGSRSYTYVTTLFYAMEEAAKQGIPVIVLDRPNPINGLTVDGPMMEEKWRSMVGYINVPYCHGMTVGELAHYFNEEYKINCRLTVVPMRGWKRQMSFQDTGLNWIPSSPNIPEATTALYYPTTGLLGELQIVSIGIGYTMPFKVVGAPWINADKFAKKLNDQKFPGVHFMPFYFRPFYGRFAHEDCQGVQIIIKDTKTFKPVSTQYLILGILKHLYPDKVNEGLKESKSRKEMFCKVNGTEEVYQILSGQESIVWKLKAIHQKEREAFAQKRLKYLLPEYAF